MYDYYSSKVLHGDIYSTPIYNALRKYGHCNFTLEILEYCAPEKCIEREQYYFDNLNPEYNILKIAGSPLGYRHTEDTLKLFRDRVVSAETRKNLSKAAIRRVLTEADKEKISKARTGIKLSDETKKKISDASIKLRGVHLKVIDIEANTESLFDTVSAAA